MLLADTNMSLVFRIHGPSGRVRVEVPPNCSLKQLYKIVAEKCQFETAGSFVLYMESNYRKHVRHSSSILVASTESGLTDGQVLFAKVGGNSAETSSATISPQTSADSTLSCKTAPSCSSSSTGTNAFPPSTESKPSGEPNASETLKPKFKAFDHFLNERSFNTVDLPLNQSYEPRQLVRGQPNIIPPAATLKHQAYRHVDHVEFMNVKEMDQFVRYWRQTLDMQQERAGWLFGYFREDSHYPSGIRAVVEAIYEPPQVWESGNIVFLDDPFLVTAKTVAASLGLEVVGWIFTHLPRVELLTSDEVQRIAQLQLDHITTSHYSGYSISPFVTVTVALDMESNGHVSTNAYMVSDLGMAFQRDGILLESADPRKMHLRPSGKNELLPDILESGKSTTVFDPDWLIVRVNDSAPKQIRSLFQSWTFPVENRQKQVRPSDLPAYLRSCERSSERSTSFPSSIFADWHLLLYIARLFDAQTASAVCEKILTKQPIDPDLVETFKML